MSTPETATLCGDARFKLREILRTIPGSHEQWADIQDVLDTDAVDVGELLRVLAAIRTAVRAIVTTTDRELAQLRRERDIVRSYLGITAELTELVPPHSAYTVHMQPTQAFTVDQAALTRWASRSGPAALEHDLPVHGSPFAINDSDNPTLEFVQLAYLAIENHVILGDPRLTLDVHVANDDDGEAFCVRLTNSYGPRTVPGLISQHTPLELAPHALPAVDKAHAYLNAVCAAANKVLADACPSTPEPIPAAKESTR
ncbi:Uncharacterised protein [Mycobacteroides abscessus subsp. massiliense]|uniref:hypothetical protein n=1 Tax=Mycobacteroides abscessus TaxID=36809 RepID=UPI0009A6F855|nr:hypothetical protein [Mycobacteroides abscessus]MBN7324380.1 hypothetical protein [Mycobacteroides abscessus subsp. massiliense]SKL15477.1 Uncharacterised protein [Mycobacteroides abscessus subsp. massiliense]SKM20852.1 Uncharacterised protein [Mycobacteroides abscessus subsp. massiliense]SKM76689.1 Uncharacterised protein [Mycobacteroides abscessus subsp. massiliense]SKN40515.1 Uncharacterised protein [Mycobacteroides abscessus subsp. abscessus]